MDQEGLTGVEWGKVEGSVRGITSSRDHEESHMESH